MKGMNAVIENELALCCHNVTQSSFFNKFDCNKKLCSHIFSYSKVGSKVTSVRTKAMALVTSVLAHWKVTECFKN
jgi:hypothetical protein